MTKKLLSPTEKLALKEFKTQILQKLRGEVLALKIFGSKARGDFKKTSDIDILILLKKSTERNRKIIFDIVVDILLKYGIDLSIKVFSKKEFQEGLRLEIPFYLEVNREAQKI